MSGTEGQRPRLLLPRDRAGVSWWLTIASGIAVVVWAVRSVSLPGADAVPAAVTVGVTIALALLPVRDVRRFRHVVNLWYAPAFAALYVWGVPFAVLLSVCAVTAGQVQQRRTPWAAAFNVAQYALAIALAGAVLAVADTTGGDQARRLPLMAASWLVFFLVTTTLVATLAGTEQMTFRESFAEEFGFYLVGEVSVLALSPILAVALQSGHGTWLFPLLLLPALAMRSTSDRLRHQEARAESDPLTGLANRAGLDRALRDCQGPTAEPAHVGLCVIGLDALTAVNDRWGHYAGDEVLRVVAHRLVRHRRSMDTVAHIGGGEFVVLMPAIAAPDDAERAAQRLLQEVQRSIDLRRYGLSGAVVRPTARVGVAVCPAGPAVHGLLGAAESEMATRTHTDIGPGWTSVHEPAPGEPPAPQR